MKLLNRAIAAALSSPLVFIPSFASAQSLVSQIGGAVSDVAKGAAQGVDKLNEEATKVAQKANEEATRAAAEANRRATEAAAKANEEATRAAAEANRKATEAAAKANEEATKAAKGVNAGVTEGLANVNKQVTGAAAAANTFVTEGLKTTAEQAKRLPRDIAWNTEKAVRDTAAEGERTARGLVDAAEAIGGYLDNQLRSTGQALTNAEKRLREGKVVDALWHVATEPLQAASKNAAIAAQQSAYLNGIAQVAATAYAGPQGAAAYAAWLTFEQTGSAEAALKAGVLTYATSLAFQTAGTIETKTLSDVARKAAITASIGGMAIAAAGGNEQAIREGFLRSGAMVLVQDGYKRYLGSDLDARASRGEAYCMSAIGESCSPPEAAYVKDANGQIMRDSQGLPIIDMSKVDPRVPHVGKWSGPTSANWSQERSSFMTSVSRVPGMNAMALFHDQWSVSWDMGTIANPATIIPAIVLTYTGTGTNYYDLLRKTAATTTVAKDVAANLTEVKALAPPSKAASGTLVSDPPEVVIANQSAYRTDAALFSAVCTGGSGDNRIVIEVTEPNSSACRVVVISSTDEISVLKVGRHPSECEAATYSHINKLVATKSYCFTRLPPAQLNAEIAVPELAVAINEKRNTPFPTWRRATIGLIFLSMFIVVGAILGAMSMRILQRRGRRTAA